ncbi:AAA family ATPase [Thermodesulfobacteriota bacterium]
MKIAVSGTHGTGKTAVAMQLAAGLKRQNPGKTIGLLTEVARMCPFPLNRRTTDDAQRWIFYRQLTKEIEMKKECDILICDRSVIDCLAYSQAADLTDMLDVCFPQALEWINTYSRIYWVRINKRRRLVDDGFRDTDPEFQAQIDFILGNWFEQYLIETQEMIFNPGGDNAGLEWIR